MLATASLVLVSCCGCMVVVEKLARHDPECMNLMTFSTFLFVTMEGLVSNPQFIMHKPKIPLKAYVKIVILFFLVNVINNQALSYNIPVPLHIIFRSGSLMTNLLLGVWILNKRYSWVKYISVLMITAGIMICTSATYSASVVHGVCMLTFALVFSSALGIAQEKLYCQYGKHPREAMFFIHMLSLPGFLLFYKDIMKHTNLFNQSELIHLPWIGLDIPHLWMLLILVDIAQYFCIRFVYYLTASCSTLTVTLVITIRKFISLISSILLFSSPFTVQHWIGTALVFGGTLLFIEPFKRSNSDKVKTN
ncbi:UDP-xylose and UDP-N-acetylglucosamine transporter [Trichinella pseudospiralis]|uniref:UDP-xylose and UDP-N-acetylglucosamine transporter n=1 Tax=Trichinella pseudospiralis TaxID=6337 RepID=A0A0V1FBE4_TRIPS|nr:UDP-xylose and UDP-N-acetylglucosamine transporter [Trichinella pseudospiralis]